MASNAKQTLDCIRNGSKVVLNLGLDGPATGLTTYQRQGVYVTALREFMKGDYVAQLLGAYYQREPTLVVSGYFKDDAANSLLLWDMIVAAQQDCIAIYYTDLDDPKGYLMGPNVEAWGEFNLDLFEMPIGLGGTDD